MTLQQLHQVITIAESRSMNEASRKLFVSQPNLSAVVRELEEEAGITIFIRSNSLVQSLFVRSSPELKDLI